MAIYIIIYSEITPFFITFYMRKRVTFFKKYFYTTSNYLIINFLLDITINNLIYKNMQTPRTVMIKLRGYERVSKFITTRPPE